MYVIKQRLTKMLNDKKQKQKWGQKLDGLQIRRLGGEVTKIPCPPLIPPFWPLFSVSGAIQNFFLSGQDGSINEQMKAWAFWVNSQKQSHRFFPTQPLRVGLVLYYVSSRHMVSEAAEYIFTLHL